MSDKIMCLQCGNTGIKVDGSKCDCGCLDTITAPNIIDIPSVYQVAEFSKLLVPIKLEALNFGSDLEEILNEIRRNGKYNKNLLICAPPNSGKTVFAYSVFKALYLKGVKTSKVMDLIEARELLFSNSYSDIIIEEREKLLNCPISIIKLPLDLPSKFVQTMLTLLESRVRKNGITIFLYSASFDYLQNQDKLDILKYIIKDGSYNSLLLMNYFN